MNKILMIDDDIDDQYFYKDMFLEISRDLEFECFSDFGSLKKRYFSNEHKKSISPNLVLLDLNLPKISGKEIYKELKSNNIFEYIPIVILTTSASPIDMKDCREMGVAGYFVKPIEYEECKILTETIYKFYFEFNALTKL